MIKPWLILTKNWFRSRIGWNVTKWSRCLHIEQFCISKLLVSNWKSSTCIWLQLIDYIANEIISIIGDWISRIGSFLVAHCSIKFHFKYWNILQCHLITVTFFRLQKLTSTISNHDPDHYPIRDPNRYPNCNHNHFPNCYPNFWTVPESKFSAKLPFEFRPW